MNDQRAVCISGLCHRYGKSLVLDVPQLTIPAACIAGFIGPDGVGKSTLLALIASATRIKQGRIMALGGDMAGSAHRRRVCGRIAYMPQGLGRNLYPTLSVAENMDFFGCLFGHDQQQRKIRSDELLHATGLSAFKGRAAGNLSGGMKQKLGLCCALIHDPDLLILDEPTTGVDPLSRRQFWALIARIRLRSPTMSVLVASAHLEEAERFDWLAAMIDGKVLASGSPAALKQHCSNLDEAYSALLPAAIITTKKPVIIASAATIAPQVALVTPVAPPGPAPDAQTDIAIEARNLSCRFGDFIAVDHVSFQIRRSEIFGFLGPNGCGKTTTMKMLTGLLPVTDGDAVLFGQRVDSRVTQAGIGSGYIQEIIARELMVFVLAADPMLDAPVALVLRAKFNPNLESSWFMPVMEIINNITMLALFLSGAAIIREREHGTTLHLLAMPLRPFDIMLAKVWANGLVIVIASVLSLRFIVQWLLGVPIAGSLSLFVAGLALYLFSVTALGILLGTLTRSMPQFSLLAMPVFIMMNLLSGGTTPQYSMPVALQAVMQLSPSTHFVRLACAILYRGAGFDVVWPDLIASSLIGALFFGVALLRFRHALTQ